MENKKLKAFYFGRFGETLTCWYLRLKGYRIVKRNYRSGFGEVDIIAQRAKTLCFIEVKSRETRNSAVQAVSVHQQKRLVRAAGAFLSANPRYVDYNLRFDLVAIAPKRWPYHLKNAWFDEQ